MLTQQLGAHNQVQLIGLKSNKFHILEREAGNKAIIVVQRLLHYDCLTLSLLSLFAPRCSSRRTTWMEPYWLAVSRGVPET